MHAPDEQPTPSALQTLQAALYAATIYDGLHQLLAAAHQAHHSSRSVLSLTPEVISALSLTPLRDVVEHDADAMFLPVCVLGEQPAAPSSHMLLPLLYDQEALGWLRLEWPQSADAQLAPQRLLAMQAVVDNMCAMLVWSRRQAEREHHALRSVRMLMQQIQQTRLVAVNDLAAGLAHEINNPVSAIVGMATLLQREPNMPTEVVNDLKAMTVEALRISDLVGRLAHFGQANVASKAPVAINSVIADTLALMGGLLAQRHIVVNVVLPPESPLVLGSQAQLQQLCLDLFGNAVDAMETSDEPTLRLHVTQTEQRMTLAISDNGCGIPEEYRERVFEPGFTTKSKQGTRRALGVGLPMAQEIVRVHWGSLRLESVVWRGTSCFVELPTI